jgi:hypothetical protein
MLLAWGDYRSLSSGEHGEWQASCGVMIRLALRLLHALWAAGFPWRRFAHWRSLEVGS